MTAFDATFGLLVTFGGIGIVVNGVLVYIGAQIMGERAANRRAARRQD